MIVPPRESPTFVHGPGVDLVYDSSMDPSFPNHEIALNFAPNWTGLPLPLNLIAYRQVFVYIQNEGAAGCTNNLVAVRVRWGIGSASHAARTVYGVWFPLLPGATDGDLFALHRAGVGFPVDVVEPWMGLDFQTDGGFPNATCQVYVMGRK